jgi:undecaprenyl diphosphate synthase
LIWQSSYAEYLFSPTLWPDFNREELWRAISEFGGRQRRFGAAEDAPLN